MDFVRPKDPLFVPLGGTGEIGMNLNVYAVSYTHLTLPTKA